MANKKIQESIELLSTNPLTQFNVDKVAGILSEVLEEYKDLSSSSLKTEYNNQYNIHKNDNVIIKELPYINREFYKHTFIPNEDVLIGFYVDNHNETYYRDEIIDVDTCVEVTNIINPLLDEANLIEEAYMLDVSTKEKGR